MKIQELSHKYAQFELNILNLELKPNTVIGLIGENGAGKTTFMNVLSGLIPANVMLNIENYDENKILFIPSDLQPYDFLSVAEFCELILSFNHSIINAEKLLYQLELVQHKDKRIVNLSQGMKKKLSLIPLFIADYDIVILDEPFNGIDIKYIRQLKQLIQALRNKATILISSHILDTLYDLCDEFVFMQDGKIKKVIDSHQSKEDLERELFDDYT